MVRSSRGNWLRRTWRRVGRWWQDTPPNAAAQTVFGIGAVLIIAAGVIYVLARNYG
jgi:hypothetical protein